MVDNRNCVLISVFHRFDTRVFINLAINSHISHEVHVFFDRIFFIRNDFFYFKKVKLYFMYRHV